jgi:hypothetical protein
MSIAWQYVLSSMYHLSTISRRGCVLTDLTGLLAADVFFLNVSIVAMNCTAKFVCYSTSTLSAPVGALPCHAYLAT